jgi:coronin-1B/1C/6
MSSRFVRSSKYRHVFGTPAKKELIFDGIKPSKSAWDSNKVTANTKYIGCIWDAGGGGAFCVLNQNKLEHASSVNGGCEASRTM